MPSQSKKRKPDVLIKPKTSAKHREKINDPDEIISKIEEDTKVLEGIISRFSKPLPENDND